MAFHFNCDYCGERIREDTAHAVSCPVEEKAIADRTTAMLQPKQVID